MARTSRRSSGITVRSIVLSGQTLLVTPYLRRVHFPLITILISSLAPGGGGGASVGRAMVICFGDRGFESRRGQRFFSFSMWAHFVSRAGTQKVLVGIFLEHFNLTTFKLLYTG